jgi:DNA helicase-2/ATP-dependent DNA helicase PcrA
LKRIINYPARGIGSTTIVKIATCAQMNHVSLWSVVSNPVYYQLDVNKGTLAKIASFRELINSFVEQLRSSDAYELGKLIIQQSGISQDLYSGSAPESISRQENLQEFLDSLQDFVVERKEEGLLNEIYLPDFLQEVSLLTDLDSDDGDERNRVALMTIHAAKGLEFPTVFVVGMEENIFPSPMSCNSARELEEERRLLYVAITRAERHCILTCAKNRWRYGKLEFDAPSRFLHDIDPRLMIVENENQTESILGGRNTSFRNNERMQNSRPVGTQFRADPKPKITSTRQPEVSVDPFSDSFKQLLAAKGGKLRKVSDVVASSRRSTPAPVSNSTPSPSNGQLAEGAMIEHQRFGIGKVIKIEGTGENTKATVEFRNSGTKQLLLKFARFTVIG